LPRHDLDHGRKGVAAFRSDFAVSMAIGPGLPRSPHRRLLLRDPHHYHPTGEAAWTSGDDQTMLASVPKQGAITVYPALGEAVGWASIAGVIVAAGALVVRRHRLP
jgi:hypothetical protein